MQSLLKCAIARLEDLSRQNVSISRGLDLIEASAQSCGELVVINVMRDCFQELLQEQHCHA